MPRRISLHSLSRRSMVIGVINVPANAGLSSFLALGTEDLQAPLTLVDTSKIWVSQVYPGPRPLDVRPKHPMDKPSLVPAIRRIVDKDA
ncbi:hypothetical protein TNCV_2209811 [Trichonephila clavipes]|nr:hypothetical protein TNCV_2209811 [Trichonephila clavipes]